MADLSKIKLNGVEYELKDAVARSNISALENAGYQNSAQVNSAIATAIGNINQFEVAMVTDLPTTDINTHTIYFKSNSSSGNNVYDEYMYINNNWELIGSTQVDLSNYVEASKRDTSNSSVIVNNGFGQVYLQTITERSNYSKVDLKGSNLNLKSWVGPTNEGNANTITLTPTQTTIKNIITPTNDGDAANKKYVDDSVSAISIPTKTSDLTNDSGYITSYTETDPIFTASAAAGISSTDISNWNAKSDFSGSYNDLEDKPTIPNVPAWALAENKPTYTANEVGALPNTTVIPTVPTDVSAFNNDAGYLTSYTETDPTVPAWAKAANKPAYTAAEVGALPDTTVIPAAQVNADWDATSGIAQILHKPTIPTVPTNVSAFTNDSGYLTSYTETDPTVPAWAKAESKPTYTAQEVGALPDDTIIPTVPTNVSAFTNDAGYLTSYTETDPTVPAWAKASAKPTYTASEVGAAASSHVHGNVKNDGTITVNTSMANGDRLLFSDTSDSSKIKNSNITIGTSTTQYLANNGTWQNLPTVSVSQTLTSGTEIGSVNNTKLYAPAPYDDSALAARVTALEQLEWATYYSGRSNPSNSQGQNGDIYLQY